MSDTISQAYAKFDELRSEFHKTKKVAAFFTGMIELLETEGGKKIAGSIKTEYNFQAAACRGANAQGFAACAAKYGFPVELGR